jgi:hypothetical protein
MADQKNFAEKLQGAANTALFECKMANADMYISPHQRKLYEQQYQLLKELQTTITETKLKIDRLNFNL